MRAPDAFGHGHRRQPLEQIFLEGRFQPRADRHVPAAFWRESLTFYRILLGHQHRQILREMQILGAEGMMVGEGMLQNAQPGVAQLVEKPPWIADSGHCMHRALAETGQRDADAGIGQIDRPVAAQRHQIFVTTRRTVTNHEIHLAQAGGRFP